jgi:flavin-binding protein dodecin
MSDQNRVYKMVEIVGTSSDSIESAVASGIERASKTVRHIDWFEVTELRGRVEGGKVAQYQVKMKLGFRLDD